MNVWLVAALFLIAIRIGLGLRLFLDRKKRQNVRTMTVLGSGGHTAEMLTLLRSFDLTTYTPRCYIVASTDKMSAQKARAFEQGAVSISGTESDTAVTSGNGASSRRPSRKLGPNDRLVRPSNNAPYLIETIPRSREVGQSFSSSIWTTLRALWYAVRPVFSFLPDVLLVNGPGTGVPVVAGAVAARILGLASCRIVYIESIARVKHLSLTGRILYHLRLTDEFLVQWEELKETHPRAVFAGRLM